MTEKREGKCKNANAYIHTYKFIHMYFYDGARLEIVSKSHSNQNLLWIM